MKTYLFVCSISLMLAGCATDGGGGPLGIVLLDPNQHVAAAEPLFSKKEDKCASDPIFILHATSGPTRATTATATPPSARDSKPNACKALAERFSEYAPNLPSTSSPTLSSVATPATVSSSTATSSTIPPPPALGPDVVKRNNMLDSLAAASDLKCGRYISFLKAYDGNINSMLGTAALITAGTSPLVAGEATAKILAGVSAMLNGTRETFNQTHFANQTIQIIAAAIQKLRQQERQSIRNYEQCPLENYSTAAGFADMINYHASCSVVFGLAETARDVERANSPDLAAIKQMLTEIAALQTAAAALTNPKADTGTTTATDASTGSGTSSGSGTSTGTTTGTTATVTPAKVVQTASIDPPVTVSCPYAPIAATTPKTTTSASH